jgi:hypothetical protein
MSRIRLLKQQVTGPYIGDCSRWRYRKLQRLTRN